MADGTAAAEDQHISSIMEEPKTAVAAVEEKEPEREHKVIFGKRMVRKKLPMDRVQRMLDLSPKPLIAPQGPHVDPLILASYERCVAGLAKVRERQDAMREDLRTNGYVMGWLPEDDE